MTTSGRLNGALMVCHRPAFFFSFSFFSGGYSRSCIHFLYFSHVLLLLSMLFWWVALLGNPVTKYIDHGINGHMYANNRQI
mmetsp:Transcript_12723/g.20951  ORF Transcript_12723/g.20951 Transcript_12723/m.20951 type:complete len:81 (-) Transcript_12723:36-278(-)